MKSKNLLLFALFFGIMIISMPNATAQTITIPNPVAANDIPELINKIAIWLLEIGSVVAVIIILWAAILFMTSGGNPNRVTQAKQILLYTIIGLTILLLATGLTALIRNFLSGNFFY